MKKLLFSVMTIMTVVGLVGGGAFAWFSDTEASAGNTFTAGSLDLKMTNKDGVANGVIATASNMAPGVVVGPYTVNFENVGSLDAIVLVNLSYVESDVTPQVGEFANIGATAEDYAKMLVVTDASLDAGGNIAGYWAQQAIDKGYGPGTGAVVADAGSPTGYLPTIYGLSKITLRFTPGHYGPPDEVWALGETHAEVFSLKLSEDANNDYQFDGIEITLTASMIQTNATLPAFP